MKASAVATGAAITMIVASGAGLLVAAPVTAAPSGSAVSRQSTSSHVAVGGGNVLLWSTHRSSADNASCTLSFTVVTSTGATGSLTAGHCAALLPGSSPYTVHQTEALPRNRTQLGDELGTVKAGHYFMGKKGDAALITLAANRTARPRVFTGGKTSQKTIPVVGRKAAASGLKVCYSGAASGEHCGFTIKGKPKTVDFAEGKRTYRIHHEWAAYRSSCPSQPGDSGSPVYVKKNGKAYAVGMLSGALSKQGKCPFYFTGLGTSLNALKLKLATAR